MVMMWCCMPARVAATEDDDDDGVDEGGGGEVPRVLVTCRSRLGRQIELLGDETDIVPLYYHIVDNFQIQFSREEFCLVIGLRFGVEYSDDYDNDEDPIPFRRRMFSSSLDGTKKAWNQMLKKDAGREKMYEENALSLCSEYQSIGRGGPSSFPTQGNNSFFEGDQATPSYGHNMAMPNWQTPMPSHPAFNLGNAFHEDNVRGDDVIFLGEHDTGHCLVYEDVDPNKFCGGDENERELLEMGEVGVILFGGEEGEDDIENLRRSERFRSEEVIEMEKNDVHI
ncbi:hypothetical protein Tco_1091057 [Tanacetum coccineum]|uniref:Uncharacterized protein n=1 Tax=Tanacetum coccineum TaxID=301880 RepID=A0ABQ5I735_9ASTR